VKKSAEAGGLGNLPVKGNKRARRKKGGVTRTAKEGAGRNWYRVIGNRQQKKGVELLKVGTKEDQRANRERSVLKSSAPNPRWGKRGGSACKLKSGENIRIKRGGRFDLNQVEGKERPGALANSVGYPRKARKKKRGMPEHSEAIG